ncbi:MAG TPA: hypothetical protein VFX54_02120, partial [Candidatus Binatia bacterium]|nr:hypothetical protein [Candidatus Binatia bacterium]
GARSRNEAQRTVVLERYRQAKAEVLSTYEDGAVIVESDGNTLRFWGYKSGRKGEINLTTNNDIKTLTVESTKGTK